jgi:hypothetical protein
LIRRGSARRVLHEDINAQQRRSILSGKNSPANLISLADGLPGKKQAYNETN